MTRTFWFFGTVFIFILAANWIGLVPGFGSIGWGHDTPEGFVLEQPLLRGANADVNMTLAMALVFFACWIVWGLREQGPVGFAKELFAPKGESTGLLRVLLVVVFFAAGLLEVVSILFRPVSLSFRLYGNVFAGENMLETVAAIPVIGWVVQIPFYFLELLVGLVQALVFTLLTAVFTLLICQHHEEHPAAALRTARIDRQTGNTPRKDSNDDRQYSYRVSGTGRSPCRRDHRDEGVGGRRTQSGFIHEGHGAVHSGHRLRRGDRVLHALPRAVAGDNDACRCCCSHRPRRSVKSSGSPGRSASRGRI